MLVPHAPQKTAEYRLVRWLDRVVPEDPTDAVQKLQSTRERVLRSSNEIVRQMFLYALLYVLVVALPVVWSRVAYLLPLVLLTYNVIALKTLSVYVHGSIRGRLLRKHSSEGCEK